MLEKLEDDIRGIEEYTIDTQERQRRYVGNFLIISIGLYVIGFIIFYFLFFPPTWKQRIIYSTPLLLFPIVLVIDDNLTKIPSLIFLHFQNSFTETTCNMVLPSEA